MIVGGDVGGTKTLLGLFEPAADRLLRVGDTYSYATNAYQSVGEILGEFTRAIGAVTIDAAAIGVAGPVVGNAARLTNVTWDITASEVAGALGTRRVRVLNDLEALAHSVETLTAADLHVLHSGLPRSDGNVAVIAAGTGLGEALLHRAQRQRAQALDSSFRVPRLEAWFAVNLPPESDAEALASWAWSACRNARNALLSRRGAVKRR